MCMVLMVLGVVLVVLEVVLQLLLLELLLLQLRVLLKLHSALWGSPTDPTFGAMKATIVYHMLASFGGGLRVT